MAVLSCGGCCAVTCAFVLICLLDCCGVDLCCLLLWLTCVLGLGVVLLLFISAVSGSLGLVYLSEDAGCGAGLLVC